MASIIVCNILCELIANLILIDAQLQFILSKNEVSIFEIKILGWWKSIIIALMMLIKQFIKFNAELASAKTNE